MTEEFHHCMEVLVNMDHMSSAECSLAAEFVGTEAFKYPNLIRLSVEILLRRGLRSGDTLVIEGCLIGLNAMLGTSWYPNSETIEDVYAVLGTTKNSNISELAYAFVNRISEEDEG